MTADQELLGIVREIELVEEDIRDRNKVKSDIYKAAADKGYDKKTIRKVVAARRLDPFERGEQDQIFDTYMQAVERAEKGVARAREEKIEKFDPETGEVFDITPRLAKQVVDGMQTEAGGSALMAAVDIMIEREEAGEQNAPRPSVNDEPSPEAGPQAEASPAGTGTGTLADREGRHEGKAVSADLPTNSEIDPTEDRKEGQSPDGGLGVVGANTGGDHVTDHQSFAAQAGASVQVAPATYVLRPNCLNKENCGGYGSKHCGRCLNAMRKLEAAE